jgi:hypothetical protein
MKTNVERSTVWRIRLNIREKEEDEQRELSISVQNPNMAWSRWIIRDFGGLRVCPFRLFAKELLITKHRGSGNSASKVGTQYPHRREYRQSSEGFSRLSK